MKKLVILTVMVVLGLVSANADVYVNGYYKKDGTYVQPHTRSNPDGNPYNNYSYRKSQNYQYGYGR